MNNSTYTIGLDFGSDSVRALLVDVQSGNEISSAVAYYPRWAAGKFCIPHESQFRQHPLDYIESMQTAVSEALAQAGDEIRAKVVGIGVDTTGSTPCAVNQQGVPLSMLDEFGDNPHAMFLLWKDHTAVKEAAEINAYNEKSDIDYLKYVGGIYSSEWFWAKIIRTYRVAPEIKEAAYSWVEHCDWIPFLLTGGQDIKQLKRGVCSAGHKALWHKEYGGMPPVSFLGKLDESLADFRVELFKDVHPSDQQAGTLSAEWAKKLGLPESVSVAVGAYDAHMGAVGGQIEPGYLSKVIGTSTCDVMVAPLAENEHLVKGICGQVEGSVIPGMLGLEAGQSAFGDIYAWFKRLLTWPLASLKDSLGEEQVKKLSDNLIANLAKEAATIVPSEQDAVSIDWMNGRRTPDANQNLKGALSGINLGTDAPRLFKSLVEATCFGARKIVDRFVEEGVEIKGIIALGGVAKKSPYVMQTLSDVMQRPIKIVKAEQTCALGAAMFAAVASGAHNNIAEAMDKMGSGFEKTYQPNPERADVYNSLYAKYSQLGDFIEENLTNTHE